MKDIEILGAAVEYLKEQPKVDFHPYPDYDGRVMAALNTLDPDYDYPKNHEKIADKPIEEMDLKDLSTMYTFIQRGERFCDGHIAGFIEDGTLLKLFTRHIELLTKEKKLFWRSIFGGKKNGNC